MNYFNLKKGKKKTRRNFQEQMGPGIPQRTFRAEVQRHWRWLKLGGGWARVGDLLSRELAEGRGRHVLPAGLAL